MDSKRPQQNVMTTTSAFAFGFSGKQFLIQNLFQKWLGLILAAALPLILASCFPNPPEDDEGHASFAREAIPVVLGRRAHGVDEVEVVADIAQFLGRDVAVDMLMKDDAFVDHWADVFIDLLKIQRDTLGGVSAQDSTCWGEPTREDPDPAIATWVRDHAPGDAGAPSPAWNMTDLVRSSILIDDLSPLYRANLFTFSMRLGGSGDQRANLTPQFLRTYLNRDITCLRCHNPTYSASNKTDGGGNVVWQRLWNVPGHPEKALFGNYYDTVATTSRVEPVFRGDVRVNVSGASPPPPGTRPWGIDESCSKDTLTQSASNNAAPRYDGFQTLGGGATPYASASFGSLDGSANPQVSLWELESALRQGVADLEDGYERFPASSPLLPPDEQEYCDVVQVFSGNCVGCHSGGSPSAGLDLANDPGGTLIADGLVIPNDAASSELFLRVTGASTPQMPLGGSLSAADQSLIGDWINNGATVIDTDQCNTSDIPDVHPDEAFAFLTAANIVDGVWMSTFGYRLTIDHGYPRNRKQRDMLWNLTEYEFVSKGWSLKTVLSKVLSSDWFARRAPTISQASNAYQLPMIVDPWVEADPTEVANPPAHQKANGQGALVERFRVNTLLRTVASTLNWKEPRRFPGGGYPSPLDQDLGQYISPGTSGFQGVNFQSLLALEAQAGLCNKTNRSVDANDWIDKLVTDIVAFNSANPDAPITVAEAWSVLKDRLIQDPTIETQLPVDLNGVLDAKTEEQAMIAFFNQGVSITGGVDANTSTGEFTSNSLSSKLREACGVLVKTPEFMLTNVTPRGYSDNNMPDPPRLNVCMEGEACGYPASCSEWRSNLWSMGHRIACEDRSMRTQPWYWFPFPIGDLKIAELEYIGPRISLLCPKEICAFVKVPKIDLCLVHPELCGNKPPIPPPCDPRAGISANYCGRNLPTSVHDIGALVTWAEGGIITQAEGARIFGVNQRDWQTLNAQTRLQAGDLLYVPLKGTLMIKAGDLEYGAKPLSIANNSVEGIEGHFISVTGPSMPKVLDARTQEKAIKFTQLRAGVEAGRYESRGLSKADWKRSIGYGALPVSRYTPTPEEIAAENENFDALHFPPESGMAADGTDLVHDLPVDQTPPTQPPTNPPASGGEDSPINSLWILFAIILIMLNVIFWLAYRSKS